MAASYKHDPLPEGRFIRLLHLHPARNLKTPLRCSVTTVALEEIGSPAYKYEALSYVWGSPVGDRSLAVGADGKSLLITQNCETAMKYLRLRKETRTLWIDSICIDQQCINEKNHQLSLMGDIYRQAWKTLIWLGPEHEKVLREMQRMQNGTGKLCILLWTLFRKRFAPKKPSMLERFRALCNSPWFTRVWTLQELLLSPNPYAVSRSALLPWGQLLEIAKDYIIYGAIDHGDILSVLAFDRDYHVKYPDLAVFEEAARCEEFCKPLVESCSECISDYLLNRKPQTPEGNTAAL